MIYEVGRKIRVVNPTDEFIQYCKKELTLPNPEYSKKARMGFWTGNTPKTLTLYEIRGGEYYLPFGCIDTVPLPSLSIPAFPSPVEMIDYNATVSLYDYQEKAVNAMYQAGYGILQSPAGSGKTQMGIALAVKEGLPCLWLCHTKDLLNQSKERAEQYIDKSLIGTITEGKVNVGRGITFATVQTMANLNLDDFRDQWDVVIVDECHRVAGTPTTVTRYEKVLSSLAARHKFGLSATVHRADGLIKATYALLGQVKYVVSDEEVADKIMQVEIFPVGTGTEISRQCLNTDGTINYTKLITYLTEDKERNLTIIENLITTDCGHSVLILSDRLEHLRLLKDLLPDYMQNDAVMISGKMTSKKGKEEREQAIEDMRTGKKHYLFATYSLAKEGLDIPRLDRLFLTTPQKDYAVVTQSIGRIARTFEGKKNAVVYDFVDNIGFCVKSYKKRCTTYRKNKCYFIRAGDDS